MNSLALFDQRRNHDVDAVEEMRMRSWARRHYIEEVDRRNDLHPIILDEMHHRDQELRHQIARRA